MKHKSEPLKGLFKLTFKEQVNHQEETEKSFARHVPIIGPADPKAHTEIYKLHKYWARRPYSVFTHLVQNYTSPGPTILDPFAGGGVTLVEGLQLRRKVISLNATIIWGVFQAAS